MSATLARVTLLLSLVSSLAVACSANSGSQDEGGNPRGGNATGGGGGGGSGGMGGTSGADGSANSGGAGGSGGSTGSGGTGGFLIDANLDVREKGCNAVDILFVIDNSGSMCSYQQQLSAAFPKFADAIDTGLPYGTNLHVGITTSCFKPGGSHAEINCKPGETQQVVDSFYVKPQDQVLQGNGYQGRLLQYDGKTYFQAVTGDPNTMGPFKEWFSNAATSVGCRGGMFEFTVAGAAYEFNTVNATNNAGFVRDSGAVLVIFWLTDEADHSPEPLADYHSWIVAAKKSCGGDACIIPGGLINEGCAAGGSNIWQFMNAFKKAPIHGNITGGSTDFTKVLGEALAPVVLQVCNSITPK